MYLQMIVFPYMGKSTIDVVSELSK
jgi:hypothetical protein